MSLLPPDAPTMTSFLRHLYESHATPIILDHFGDEAVGLTYRMGTTEIVSIVGVIRSQSIEDEETIEGDLEKHRRCSIVVHCDSLSHWRGINDPQLQGTVTITKADGTSTEWAIDPLPGRGISVLGESMHEIHLMRTEHMRKAFAGSRIR